MKILSIDVGLVSPSFVILEKDNEEICIFIYSGISFQKITDSKVFLNYLISQNLDLVLIEQQNSMSGSTNSHTMGFLQGFFESKDIEVKIVAPIANLRKDKTDKRRSTKKKFSIDLANRLLNLEKDKFQAKDSDISDAINMGLLYFHKEKSKEYTSKNFIEKFDFKIKNKVIFKFNSSNLLVGFCNKKSN